MRLVLDTDVLVAAFRSGRGASRQLLLSALDARFEWLVSVPLMLEYEAVLTRPAHLAEMGLTVGEVNEVLDLVAAVAVPIRSRFLWRPQLMDPGDEMVLETAINGGADRLVTFNVRHFARAAARFGVGVVQPRDAWREVQQDNAKE